MTREEIIQKGEEQLGYILKQLYKGNSTTFKKHWAETGIAQLDMLFFILDEEFEKYDEWFWKFENYL